MRECMRLTGIRKVVGRLEAPDKTSELWKAVPARVVRVNKLKLRL